MSASPSPREAPVTIAVDGVSVVMPVRLQVQVNLKSSAIVQSDVRAAHDRRGLEAERVASSALRFYEQRGLITSERRDGGQRRYPRHVLRRIAFIVFAQRVGLTLDEIGAELAKLDPNRRRAAPTGRVSPAWVARIDDRIAELQRLRGGLDECIGCGCLSLDRCRFANPGDAAGRAGPGPRYWLGGRAA